ncbi:myosin light chain kinase, smooth muscle-like [Branchiostoma floridae]|uniref:Myosin light chain kinase, smooth muscle-like n=1 Tax=Branchiostoma floridae TaxID=7739 RepID=A0A9J7HJT8_BRAFL|nr:myosin light chain kinase, smooth muscle-like [Branchiostoma floridae]
MFDVSDGKWQTLTTTCRRPPYPVKGLNPSATYRFRIRAENAYGLSDAGPLSDPILTKEPEQGRNDRSSDGKKTDSSSSDSVAWRSTSMDSSSDADRVDRKIQALMQTGRQETNKPPVFVRNLRDVECVEGSAARLDCSVTGIPEPEVTWYKDDSALHDGRKYAYEFGEDGHVSLVIRDVTAEDDGMYTCEAQNEAGKTSASAELLVEGVRPKQTRQTSVENTAEEDGASAVLEDEDDDDVRDLPDAGKQPPPFAKMPSFLTQGQDNLPPKKDDRDARPKQFPPKFLIKPRSSSAKVGDIVKFGCKADGRPPPEVTWHRGDERIRDEGRIELYTEYGTQYFEIGEVEAGDAGEYTCVISNNVGKDVCMFNLKVEGVPDPDPNIRTRATDSGSKGQHEMKQGTSTESSKPSPSTAPRFLAKPTSQTVQEGGDAIFVCRVSGEPAPEVLWERDGVPVRNAGRFEIFEEDDGFHLEIFDVVREDAGTYGCTLRNGAGETNCSFSLGVHVKAVKSVKPSFLLKFSDTEVLEGDPIRLECRITGEPTPQVTWYRDGKEVGDRQGVDPRTTYSNKVARLYIERAHLEDEADYTCKAANCAGEARCTAEVLVNERLQLAPSGELPVFTLQLQDISAQDGDNVTFCCKVSGTPAPKVSWLYEGKPIKASEDFQVTSRGEDQSLHIPEIFPEDAGMYGCVAQNSAGTVTTSAKLKVKAPAKPDPVPDPEPAVKPKIPKLKEGPPIFLKDPLPQNIEEGNPLSLTCEVSGLPPPTVEWQKDGKTVHKDRRVKMKKEGNVFRLDITAALSTDSGCYTALASNARGSVSRDVSISVKPLAEETTDYKTLLRRRPELSKLGRQASEGDASDEARSRSNTMEALLQAPVFSQVIADATVTEGQPVTFRCQLVGKPAPEVTWYANEKEIKPSKFFQMTQEGDACKLVIVEAFPEDAGKYTCWAQNEEGQAECSCRLVVKKEKSQENVQGDTHAAEEKAKIEKGPENIVVF